MHASAAGGKLYRGGAPQPAIRCPLQVMLVERRPLRLGGERSGDRSRECHRSGTPNNILSFIRPELLTRSTVVEFGLRGSGLNTTSVGK